MEVDCSSSILISWQTVKKSKVAFWWKFEFFVIFFLLVRISLRSSLLATFSVYIKIIKQV